MSTGTTVSAQQDSGFSIKQFLSRHEAILKKIVIAFLFMVVGFLMGRIRLIGGISPFGPAFVAACFSSRRQEVLLAAAGVCIGALLVPDDTLYIVAVVLVICSVLLTVGQARMRRWAAVLTTAGAFAIGAAIFKTADLEVFMKAVLECMVALVMIYVFGTMIHMAITGTKRTLFTVEETICLALGALVFVCMFGPLNIKGIYIASVIAQLLVLCMAYTGGAALGAGVGLALGMALCFGICAEVTMIGMMGIAGMLGGTLRKLKKPGVAFSYILTVLLFLIAFFNQAVWTLVLIETGIAVALFVALPRKVLMLTGRYIDLKTRREFEYRMHTRRFKELTVGRLQEVSEVFLQTGDMFAKEAESKVHGNAQISGILSVVADNTCKDCVFRKSCWDKEFLNTYSVFNRLFVAFEKHGYLDESHIDTAFAKKCYNVKGILTTAQSMFASYLLSLKWQKKIEQSRMITGKQLKGVAKVVADIGREVDTGFKFLESVEEQVAAALDAANYRVKEVCAESLAGGVAVGIKIKGVENESGRSLESVVSGACGKHMQKASETLCGAGAYSTIRFEQAKRYRVETGIAKVTKDDISGDSQVASMLKDGRYLLMLCDGMGSGEAAHRESSAAVSLVENFFKAGFDDAVIFDTINRLLMLKGNDEVFTTVDLCVLDLKTGDARFTKIGAETSYILSDDGVTTVTPGSLPMGIIDEVKPVSVKRTLVYGDMVVMMSDGVADELGDDYVQWFADIPQTDAQSAADAIIDKALGGQPPRDDMTVMVSLLTKG